MSRVITFAKGSKRRMKQIRWKLSEVISVVTLSLIVLGLCVLFAFWEVSHQFGGAEDPPRRSKALTHNAIAELSPVDRKGPCNFQSMTRWLQMLLERDPNLFNPERDESPGSSLEVWFTKLKN